MPVHTPRVSTSWLCLLVERVSKRPRSQLPIPPQQPHAPTAGRSNCPSLVCYLPWCAKRGAGEVAHHVVQREVEWHDTPLETNVLLVLTGVHDDVRHRLESGVDWRLVNLATASAKKAELFAKFGSRLVVASTPGRGAELEHLRLLCDQVRCRARAQRELAKAEHEYLLKRLENPALAQAALSRA